MKIVEMTGSPGKTFLTLRDLVKMGMGLDKQSRIRKYY